MKQLISDKELIRELELRFDTNEKLLQEQFTLMLELRSVNEKLVASEKLKSNFLSNIRNEINNPLASVLELSKNISEGAPDAETIKRFSGLIYSEAFSLDFQLRNIFASAEIEAGEATVSGVAVNVYSVLQNIIQNFKHQVQKKKILLTHVNQSEENIPFFTDPEKLHLVVSNLISNAIQFSQAGSVVELDSSINGNVLIISVKDTGSGMNKEEREVIFDRFRQVEEGSTKTYGGHGLGLSISKAMLELLDGTMCVVTEKGKGSTFTISIPQSQNFNTSDLIFSSEGNDFLFGENDSMSF